MFPSGAAALAQRDVIDCYQASHERIRVDWCAGCLLIVDNERFLHGRGQSDTDDTDRVLKRVIVSEG